MRSARDPESDPIRRLVDLVPANKQQVAFWRALGQFLDAYAVVEMMLNVLVVRYADMTWENARALFLPLRVDAASNHLSRLIAGKFVRGKRATELTAIIQQLGQINRMRNDILHLGARPRGLPTGPFTVTNRMYARSQAHLRRRNVSVTMLNSMFYDLMEISFRIMVMLMAKRRREGNITPLDDLQIALARQAGLSPYRVRPIAWRYTPQPQSSRRNRRRASDPRRPRQP